MKISVKQLKKLIKEAYEDVISSDYEFAWNEEHARQKIVDLLLAYNGASESIESIKYDIVSVLLKIDVFVLQNTPRNEREKVQKEHALRVWKLHGLKTLEKIENLINLMIIDGTLNVLSTPNDGIFDTEERVKLSDDFLKRETDNFSLDEGINLNSNNFIFDKVKTTKMIVDLLMEKMLIREPDNYYTSMELRHKIAKELCFNKFEYEPGNWTQNMREATRDVKLLIDELIVEGILNVDQQGKISLSNDYLEKQLLGFDLD